MLRMKKEFLLTLLIFFLSAFLSYSQDGVAKIKFGEAEQAYANNDFQATLTKLDEAEKILNQSNSKILHLRIKAEYGILMENPWGSYSPVENLRNKCNFYLKEYDGKAPMEKYSEIYAITEKLKQFSTSPEGFKQAKLNRQKEEIEEYTQTIKVNNNAHEAYNSRGLIKFNLDDFSEAYKDFDMAVRLSNNNASYRTNRGWASVKLNEYARSIDDFTKAIQLQPEYHDTYFRRGYAYYFLGENLKAVEDFKKAIQFQSNNEQYYYWRAQAYYNLKDYTNAVDDFSKSIELQPEDEWNYYWRGLSHYWLDEYPNAIDDYTKGIQLNPKNNDIYFQRGFTYYKSNEYAKAVEDYTKAIQLNPQVLYYYRRAEAYYDMKEYSKSIEDYTKAIQLKPEKDNYYFYRGLAFNKLKLYPKAIEDYTKAIQLNPNKLFYYNIRAELLYDMKEFVKAVDDYTKAIELDPENQDNYYWRGKAYCLHLNDKAKGEMDFKKVLEMNKDIYNPQVPFSYYFLGDKAQALKYLQDNFSDGRKEYHTARIYSLDHNKAESLKYFKLAFEKGYAVNDVNLKDENIAFIRDTPEFKALIAQYSTKK